MGRPKKGTLSSYPKPTVNALKKIRQDHEGWGTPSILLELEEVHGYSASELPSISSVNLYLREQGLTKSYETHGKFPLEKAKITIAVHALWELDAQGATPVEGIGHTSIINMKDSRSVKYCMAFPVPVRHQRCQPATIHYHWACRLAFEESGLPTALQMDKDSVFFENTTKSPYPTRLHLWWVGLGIKVYFIKVPPPMKQAKVERSHQTIDRQVLWGQKYECWKQLFQQANKRRKRLNEKLPCRSLGNKPPLEVYPKAVHSERHFAVEQEYQLFDLNRIYDLLAKGVWYRKISKVKTLSLGGHIYYLKKAIPYSQIKITFSKKTKLFIFRNDKELLLAKLTPKGLSQKEIIGASTKELKSMKFKLKTYRDFPLKT